LPELRLEINGDSRFREKDSVDVGAAAVIAAIVRAAAPSTA
jgi:hypothetical protein